MATFSRVKTWVAGEVLTASDLNAEFDNFLNNMTPSGIEDASANVTAMQATTNPGGVGSESLATNLLGEIERLRFKVKQIIGGAQWYSTPVIDLGSLITTAKIADSAVTTAKIADANVTTAKITDLNVTTAKIADGNVTTAKIANSNVTPAKLSSVVFGAGNFTSTTNPLAGTTAYATLSSHTVTASGARPFQMFCVPDTVAGYLQIRLTRTAAGTLEVRLRVQRDGTNIGEARYSYVAGGLSTTCFGSYPVWYDPSPSAGSRTYTLQFEVFADAGGTNTVELFGRFYALEV